MKRIKLQWLVGWIGIALVGCASDDGRPESTESAGGESVPAAEPGHDHAGHDHGDHDHAGHDHRDHDHAGHDHGAEPGGGDHGHAPQVLGPHGGRVLTEFGVPAELLVREDRFVQIAFLNDENEIVEPGEPTITAHCGDRSDPTRLAFAREGEVFLSDQPLPNGTIIPMVLQVAMKPDAEKATARVSLDLTQCPTCDHLEYACACDHGHGGHGHDHGDHGHGH